MMPLILASPGEENMIRKVGGNPEAKQHLADLGFVAGGNVTVVSSIGGNLIVSVKESRVAISREMAARIMVRSAQQNNSPEKGENNEHAERRKDRRNEEGREAPR